MLRPFLARLGRLREDPSCPNHLCDALLYIWRFSYHYFGQSRQPVLEHGSSQWWEEEERRMMQREIDKKHNPITKLTKHAFRY